MARNARRNYVRDGRGRFASTPGGGPAKKAKPARTSFRQRQAVSLARQRGQTGRLGSATKAMKAKLQASRRKLATNASPQQKAAVTRAARMAAALAGQRRIKAGAQAGVLRGATAKGVKKAAGVRVRPGALKALPAMKPAKRGSKVRLPRMATPTGLIRKSDLAKVKADAKTGIGTPMSRAAQRAVARSAREAPLIRKQAIAAAKRKGRTGFGKGPQMNAGSIGSREFAWNKNETPATARERLAMWRKSEQRIRGNARRGSIGVKGAAGALRASRRAAALVDSGDRRGNLPTTRKMAEQPRQRRIDRANRNETRGSLASYEADRRLLPQIQKVRDAAQKRIAEGKKPTAAQREKERKLVGEYNKATRQFLVAKAAKSYMQNPYGFKPQRMSPSPAKPKPTRPTSKVAAPGSRRKVRGPKMAGTIAKPRGLKPGALAERRGSAPGSTRTVNRTRKQAARAQLARTRALIESTSRAVVGMPGYYREPLGGGQRWRFRRSVIQQSSLFGGIDKVAALRITPVASQRGPAPGSRSARRRAGASSRQGLSSEARRLKTFRRVMGAEDLAGRKTLSVGERRDKREGRRGSNKRRQQSEKTQRRAAKYLDARRPY